MTTDQPICCPTCKGVLAAQQPGAYTSARGRLIVANGYCQGRCPAPEPLPEPQAFGHHPAAEAPGNLAGQGHAGDLAILADVHAVPRPA